MANTKSKNTVFLAVLGLLLAGGITGGILLSRNIGKSKQEISRDTAVTQLDKKLKKISVQNVPRLSTRSETECQGECEQ